jgi:hypothetical protein
MRGVRLSLSCQLRGYGRGASDDLARAKAEAEEVALARAHRRRLAWLHILLAFERHAVDAVEDDFAAWSVARLALNNRSKERVVTWPHHGPV